MGAKKAPVEERANRVSPDIDFLRLRKSEYQIRTSKNLIRPVCRGERTPFGATRLDHFLTGEKITFWLCVAVGIRTGIATSRHRTRTALNGLIHENMFSILARMTAVIRYKGYKISGESTPMYMEVCQSLGTVYEDRRARLYRRGCTD